MRSIARALAAMVFLVACTPAISAAAKPTPRQGQVLGWKNFLGRSAPFVLPPAPAYDPAHYDTWLVETGFPSNPIFRKVSNDSVLYCFGMFDVSSGDPDGVYMTIRMYHPQAQGEVIQALPGRVPGKLPNTITFSFGYVFTGYQPAGDYRMTVRMATVDGSTATFWATVGNLQCFEMLLPPSQP